ncbi:5-hydroxytryptamine receptor 3A-like [Megalops cyprinoides]|uniref:5-hydroxytryptamine receptor 3A-like n=1 Tax=Megalops cyprinoides TaxID=118141 RepID=UPI0018648A70|nr:5-hydroxytryptamine receptor 3A-like [Megalops cyprinoides]
MSPLSVLVIGCLISTEHHPDLASMIRNITQHSSPWLRPVRTGDRALMVHTDLQLRAVLDVRWRDEFLAWDPSSYGGLTHFTLPQSSLWTPDTFFHEAREELVLLDLHCDLAMFLFPFDKQTCNLTLGSSLYTVQDLVLVLQRSADSVLNSSHHFTLHGEWELLSIQACTFTEPQGEQLYSRITYQVELGRYSLFYVVNLMVPSALVMVIDLAGFAIPAECSERIPFKITLLFGYTVFLMLVKDLLPPFRDCTPMLGLYLVVSLGFLCLSMGESVLLLALGQPDLLEHSTVLQRLATSLCQNDQQGETESLKRSYRLGQRGAELSGGHTGVGVGCGCGCVLRALAEELKEVSEEVRTLTERRTQRSDALRLMEALDQLCFRIYTSLLITFLMSLVLLWALYR